MLARALAHLVRSVLVVVAGVAAVLVHVLTDRRPGPQVGGPLTVWHFHRFSRAVCFVDGAFPAGFADREGRCRRGVPSRTSPEMLHVWIHNPDGPFAHDMVLSEGTDLSPIRARLAELVAAG